jgi:aryl-alcohol dehydrogenase-like predicted oxidoreductase
MRALHEVVTSGKVRYIGASSMKCWEFARLQHIAELRGWTKFISMQPYYNLNYREEEREMIPFCSETGVGIVPWSPMDRGLLARPLNDAKTARGEGDMFSKKLHAGVNPEIVNRVEKLAAIKGTTMAAIATAWVLHRGCCPILGLNSEARVEESLKALEVELSEADMRYLEEEYKPRADLVN